MKEQTKTHTIRTVCFSPAKLTKFMSHFEALLPVKLRWFQLKTNRQTNEEEIHVNKRTKLEDPPEHQISFDISTEAKEVRPGTAITVIGQLTFHRGTEYIDVRGKKIKKRETILTDESGMICLVLWENDIHKVQSGQTYVVEKSVVCEFDNQPYITATKKTQISKVTQAIANPVDDLANMYKEFTISCPPEGILAIHRSLSCKKCANSMVVDAVGKTIKCDSVIESLRKKKHIPKLSSSTKKGKRYLCWWNTSVVRYTPNWKA